MKLSNTISSPDKPCVSLIWHRTAKRASQILAKNNTKLIIKYAFCLLFWVFFLLNHLTAIGINVANKSSVDRVNRTDRIFTKSYSLHLNWIERTNQLFFYPIIVSFSNSESHRRPQTYQKNWKQILSSGVNLCNNLIFSDSLWRYNSINNQIDYLEQLRNDIQQRPVQIPRKENDWDLINKEIDGLNDDQKKLLFEDNKYKEFDSNLQAIIQKELIELVKDKIASSSTGKQLLSDMLNYVKSVKPNIIAESNKDLELFKKFQIAVSVNPDLTYTEFIKSLNKE